MFSLFIWLVSAAIIADCSEKVNCFIAENSDLWTSLYLMSAVIIEIVRFAGGVLVDFSERLTMLMAEKRLSYNRLGKDLGVSDRVVGAWAKGENGIKMSFAVQLADYFGVSLDYLFGRTEVRAVAVPEPEIKKAPPLELSRDEADMLKIYSRLSGREQAILLGEARGLLLAKGDDAGIASAG